MNDYKFVKTQYLELQVIGGTGSSTFTFQPQTYLQGRRTWSLETFTADDVTTSKFNFPLVSAAQMDTCFITFYCNDPQYGVVKQSDNTFSGQAFGEWFKDRPLWTFHRMINSTGNTYVRDLPLLDGQIIIWEKSFIFTTNPSLFPSNCSFLFDVGYEG